MYRVTVVFSDGSVHPMTATEVVDTVPTDWDNYWPRGYPLNKLSVSGTIVKVERVQSWNL